MINILFQLGLFIFIVASFWAMGTIWGMCAAKSGWNARQPEIDRLKKICEDMLDAGCFTESEVNDYRREIEGYPEALEGE